jgi:hypothetical protein
MYLVVAFIPKLGEGVIDVMTKDGMRYIMEKSSDLFFNCGTNSSHEYKCTNGMFEPCDLRCQAQECSDSILADSLQSLHLRALEKLYENRFMD